MSPRVFPDEPWEVSRRSQVDGAPQDGWASSNQLRASRKKKKKKRLIFPEKERLLPTLAFGLEVEIEI